MKINEEVNNELEVGRSLALKLVEHLERMRAGRCEIPIESKGIKYMVKIVEVIKKT